MTSLYRSWSYKNTTQGDSRRQTKKRFTKSLDLALGAMFTVASKNAARAAVSQHSQSRASRIRADGLVSDIQRCSPSLSEASSVLNPVDARDYALHPPPQDGSAGLRIEDSSSTSGSFLGGIACLQTKH